MDAEAGTRHSETLRTDIRPKNPTPLGVGDVKILDVKTVLIFLKSTQKSVSIYGLSIRGYENAKKY